MVSHFNCSTILLKEKKFVGSMKKNFNKLSNQQTFFSCQDYYLNADFDKCSVHLLEVSMFNLWLPVFILLEFYKMTCWSIYEHGIWKNVHIWGAKKPQVKGKFMYEITVIVALKNEHYNSTNEHKELFKNFMFIWAFWISWVKWRLPSSLQPIHELCGHSRCSPQHV